jgi:ubiquinone/menaquinone biosynthesis C-methylase UbiE
VDTDHPRRALRESYDEIAEDYASRLRDELSYKPLDRALLSMLAESAGSGAPCGDLGCGPGHVAGWLAARGLQPVGIDLSPGMLGVARQDHPEIDFRQGDLVELPADDEEFALVVALYSIIHLSPEDRPRAFSEMRRVLRPGGSALVSFHVGDEVRHVSDWWGHRVDVDGRYLPTTRVAGEMEDAGLAVSVQLERVNYPEEVPTRRAYLLCGRAP